MARDQSTRSRMSDVLKMVQEHDLHKIGISMTIELMYGRDSPESLAMRRLFQTERLLDQARKEAEDLRDVMRVHIHEDYWPFTFSWEKEEKP